ncbi:MAG TPA: tripartite tricarboxylate transporter substrate binding protein [Casimicrobiaceae bacterium]|nr:tripartite tricarboxylate transporter substrate binding protein [Casimicrobiaceae bacterium]
MLDRLKVVVSAFVLSALFASAPQTAAQPWPAKPITLIVPFSAGGGVDSAARIVAPKLGEILKQPVVIENVAGAAGTIGTARVVKSPPDGYTLLFAVASPINVAPVVSPSVVRYDTFKDLTPLSTVASAPFVLIGRPTLSAKSMAELIAQAKAQPGKLNFGTDGVGGSLHIAGELINQRAGIDLVHTAYKSGPQVLTDVSAGHVDLGILPLTLAQPFIRDGKVRAFGVTSKARWPTAPDVPALAETPALADFEIDSWLGVLAPANLDPAIAATLIRALASIAQDADVVRKMTEVAVKPMTVAGPAFTQYLQRERQLIRDVVQKAGIKVE